MIEEPRSSGRAAAGAAHWLAVLNVLAAIFAVLPLAAPALMWAGIEGPAQAIYAAYQLVCHQWASRSYFLFGPHTTYSVDQLMQVGGPNGPYGFIGSSEIGYKIAFCERDTAIYLAVLLAGLLFATFRRSAQPLQIAGYVLLLLPIAVDGLTQLVGWRESTPLLRVLTGTLFGFACVWFIYPRLDIVLRSSRAATRFAAARV